MADNNNGTDKEILGVVDQLQDDVDGIIVELLEMRRAEGLVVEEGAISRLREELRLRLRKPLLQGVLDGYSTNRYAVVPKDKK